MKAIVILFLLLLTGCATWTHPTKDEIDYRSDLYECEVQAAAVQAEWRALQMKVRCMQVKGWRAS